MLVPCIVIDAFLLCKYYTCTTVEPPKKGHFGDNAFVPCMEVDLMFSNKLPLVQFSYSKAH